MKTILAEGNTKNEIWKIRKKCMGKSEIKLAIKDVEGNIITDQAGICERYEKYYENLLQNRPVCEEYKKHDEAKLKAITFT